jgi:uncharacterized protein (TIRG00374 family)
MLVSFTIAFAASFSRVGFNLLHNGFLHRFRDARVVRKFRQLHSTYQTYQQNKRVLGTFFGLTFIEQLSRIFFTWVLARGLAVEVDLLFVAGVVPLALIVSRIPISISGWGIFDGAFLLLMSLAGVAPAESVAIVMVTRIVQIISWLPWWMAEVMNTGKVRPPMMAVEGTPIQNMPLR